MNRLLVLPLGLLLLAGVARGAAPPAPPRIATLALPGPKPFVHVARDVVDVLASVDPSLAAGAGLFADAVRVPTFAPETVDTWVRRLDADLDRLAALPWRRWDVDTQIDVRLVYAAAETARHQLVTERLYTHRPSQWLEPLANTLIAFSSYAPEHPEWADALYAGVPGMVAEMRAVVTDPTRRDLDTAVRIAGAVRAAAAARGATPAVAALDAWIAEVGARTPTREFAVVGADAYAWRFRHTLLLPWTPEELLARARASLAEVDARLAALPPRSARPAPTDAQLALARGLDRDGLLGLYDAVEAANRAATEAGGWVTIPPQVGPIHARETPDALVPLTGDGGSMNPPPTYVASNVGYWNVEHFRPEWTEAERVEKVVATQDFRHNGFGPYAAHEGFPGHHLQLALARLHPDPLRSILPDPVQNEGWGLYAEEAFYTHGGFAEGPDTERAVLGSYRARIARVVYDVNIETGVWDLQQAADFKHHAEPGRGPIDEDLLRAINWPTQLICYYAGKAQILALRDEVRARRGAAWDERAFHDAFLAEGSIPVALTRAKLLGEAVPDFPER